MGKARVNWALNAMMPILIVYQMAPRRLFFVSYILFILKYFCDWGALLPLEEYYSDFKNAALLSKNQLNIILSEIN